MSLPARRLPPLLVVAFFAAWVGAPVGAEEPIEEHVSVSRVVVDVRVVDSRGRAVPDLTADDFLVRVEGAEQAVLSVDWIPGTLPDLEGLESTGLVPPDSRWDADSGRLIVLLFQRDLFHSRMRGLIRMRNVVDDFLARLRPDDRVSVIVHDHSLKIYTDFTADRELLSRELDRTIVQQGVSVARAADYPSLVNLIDPAEAGDAAHVEDGLLLIARALRKLPGTKTLIFLGWSMNRWDGATDTLGQATGYLLDGRTTMISMDVTDAEYHSLEGPLIQAAQETGGFYVKTHVLSHGAMGRVESALAGHYELSFARPALESGRHPIKVRLRARRGSVYHRQYYYD